MRGMDGYMRGVNLGGWLSQFDAPTMSVCPWITP